MAEKDFMDGPTDPTAKPVETPKPKNKKHLVLKILGGVVLVLILLVLAAPTLLSTGPVVSIILGQVNDKLTGHVEVSSLSLGWLSGINVEGVRVFDSSKTQIAEVDHLVIPFPLWKAIIGKYDFGDVLCDGLSCDARFDSAGELNFSQLVKKNPATPGPGSPPAPPAPASESRPSKLPAVSGTIKLTNCRATVSQPGKPTLYLSKISGEFKIPDINQPITDSLTMNLRSGNGQEGIVSINGTAAAIRQNLIDLNSAEIHQTVDVTDLDLQAAKPFVPASKGVDTLEGVLGIHIAADLTGGKDATLDVAVTGKKKIEVGGKVLKGDTFSTETFTAAVPKLSAIFANGIGNWESGRIKVGSSPILLKVDQGQVTVLLDLVPQAILNMLDNKKPDSTGQLAVESNFDLGRIIPQLKNTMGLPAGTTVNNGTFNEKLTLVISPDKADLSNTTDFTQLTGTRAGPNAAPVPMSIDPIHLSMTSAYQGGAGKIPDLRGIKLSVASKSINGEFTGTTLADLHGMLNCDIAAAMGEIKQLSSSATMNAGGSVQITIGTKGQIDQPPYQSALTVNLTARDIVYASETGSPIQEPLVLLNLSANLQGSATQSIESIKDFALTLKTGDANAPTVDLLAEAPSVTLGKSMSADFHLTHLTADLAKLQREFAALPPKTDGTVIDQGTVSISGQGAYKNDVLSLNGLKIAAGGLVFTRHTADGKFSKPASGGALNVNGTATVDMASTDAEKIALKLTGNLAELTQVLAAYENDKPDAYPYRGDYTLNENVVKKKDSTALQGGLQIANFQSLSGTTVTFSEPLLAISNDVILSTIGDDESVAINNLLIGMQSTGALNIAIKNGTVHHLQTTRDLQLQPTMDYDLAKLWPVIQPIIGEKYKTVKITGQFKKQFNVTGSYPANQPSTVAIRTLKADGDIAVATFDYDGLNLQNFIVPFTLADGKLLTVYAGKPTGQNTAAPAVANGGTLDLGNFTIDLTQSPPRLFIPANKVLITKLTVNPLFANTFLASFLNNPVFTGADASGLFDLTMVDCTDLPLGDLVLEQAKENTGRADMKFSLTNLHIGFQGISGLSSIVKEDSFAANVKDGTVSIAKGLASEHMSFVTGQYSLDFDGTVRLSDEAMIPLNVVINSLPVMIGRAGVHDQNVLKYIPNSATLPVKGTVHHASVSLDVKKLIGDATAKAVENGLLGGDKNKNDNNNGDNSDPLGGLLNKLQKKK